MDFIGHSEIPARPGDVAVYTVAQSRDFISAKRIRLVTNILGNMIRGDGAALNIVAGGESVMSFAFHGLSDFLPQLVC